MGPPEAQRHQEHQCRQRVDDAPYRILHEFASRSLTDIHGYTAHHGSPRSVGDLAHELPGVLLEKRAERLPVVGDVRRFPHLRVHEPLVFELRRMLVKSAEVVDAVLVDHIGEERFVASVRLDRNELPEHQSVAHCPGGGKAQHNRASDEPLPPRLDLPQTEKAQ